MSFLILRSATADGGSALFEEDFSSYSVGTPPTRANSYWDWGAADAGGTNTLQVVTDGAAQALRFRYEANNAMCEMRFSLPTRQTELWLKQTWLFPANYAHTDSDPEVDGTNNKGHLYIWSAHEDSGQWFGDQDYGNSGRGPGIGFNYWPNSPADTYSRGTPYMWGGATGMGVGGMDTHGPSANKNGGAHDYAGPYVAAADAGTEIEIYTHLKYASAADNDGVIQTWKKRGGTTVQLHNITTARMYVSGQLGFNYGYILGFANARFSSQTDILLRYLALSTSDIWGISS